MLQQMDAQWMQTTGTGQGVGLLDSSFRASGRVAATAAAALQWLGAKAQSPPGNIGVPMDRECPHSTTAA